MSKNFQKVINVLTSLFLVDLVMTCVYLFFCYDTDNWDVSEEHAGDSFLAKLFNRFYYSTMVSTTVGLGPIAPKSKLAKSLTLIQLYITFALLPFAFS